MAVITVVPLTFLLIALVQFGKGFDPSDQPIIDTPQGPVRGQKINRTDIVCYHFVGIPYAKPPIGDLRFKAPVKVDPWNETWDATLECSMCLQPENMETAEGTVMGEEDCLYMSVYAPQFPDPDNLLPVLVWIHGGGFLTGNGNYAFQNPQYLQNEGIIYVSFNYRLGIFGFLSTEDEVLPGNAGMKDQVMALQWVQENIAAYGGDPDKVTIFGASAGGASVFYHMLSPMSDGLFRHAIAQSGSPASSWAVAFKPRETAFQIGEVLGYSGNSSQELVEFLQGIQEYELVMTARTTYPEWATSRIQQQVFYVPSVEPEVEGETQFLPDSPLNLFNQGKFKDLPFLTGITSAEGIYFHYVSGVTVGRRTFEDLEENFNATFKPDLRYCRDDDCADDMLSQIKEFYFGDQPISADTVTNLIQLLSDIYFTDGVIYSLEKMSAVNTAPIYLYHFSYDGELAFMKKTKKLEEFEGVSHADDLGYIFDVSIKVAANSTAAAVRAKTVELWSNFVKTGNPTPQATRDTPLWLPYTNSTPNYLDIGSTLSVKTHLHQERYDFWKNLYSPYDNFEEDNYYICLGDC